MNDQNYVPRMRTIEQCVKFFKENDPETKVTDNGLRVLINSGKFPVTRAGKRPLINLDKLIAFYNQEPVEPDITEEVQNKIRKIM